MAQQDKVAVVARDLQRKLDDGETVAMVCEKLKKIDVNVTLEGERLILMYLANCKAVNMVVLEMFVKRGADLNVQDDLGRSPLHWIVTKEDIDSTAAAMTLLLNNGASFTLVDHDGDTPLHLLLMANASEKLISIIFDNEAAQRLITMRNKKGWSCLGLLMSHGLKSNMGLIATLINEGTNVNERNFDCNTPLHLLVGNYKYEKNVVYVEHMVHATASKSNLKDIIETLVELGADQSAKNITHEMPIHVAIDCKRDLEDIFALMPSDEVLCDTGSWFGQPMIDYILDKISQPYNLESAHTQTLLEFLQVAIVSGANQSSSDTLNLAIKNADTNLFEILVSQLDVRITFQDLKAAIDARRPALIFVILQKADDELKIEVRSKMPGLHVKLVKIWCEMADLRYVGNETFPEITELVDILLDKFEFDINHVNEDGSLLHHLVAFSDYERFRDDAKTRQTGALRELLNRDDLDIDVRSLPADWAPQSISALNYAIDLGNHEAANLLINH